MHGDRRLTWLIGPLLAALMLAACGTTPSGTEAGGTSPAAHARTPVATARATVATPSHATSMPAQVVLISHATHYAASASIIVTVHNTSGQTIYAVTHFTDCSIISLERLVGSDWQPMNQCADGYPHPYVTRITPGAETTIQLSATMAGSNANGDGLSSWPAGTYRARLTYATSESAAFGEGTAIYSAAFTVG